MKKNIVYAITKMSSKDYNLRHSLKPLFVLLLQSTDTQEEAWKAVADFEIHSGSKFISWHSYKHSKKRVLNCAHKQCDTAKKNLF